MSLKLGFYLVNQLLLYSFAYLAMYIGGQVVIHWHVRVHYVRKVCGFLFLFSALLIDRYYPSTIPYLNFLSTLGWVACFGLLGLRRHSRFLRICFTAVDRPEDRPHTNRWIITEFVANFLVIQLCMAAYAHFHMPNLIWIGFLIVSFGDGLAEPVGFRFGRHRYTTRALHGGGRHVRSLEGSAVVFAVSAIVLWIYRHPFSPHALLAAFCIVPLVATVAEAVSPHTCDGPLMHLGIAASMILVFLTFM
jgi:dolichol kinase